MRMMKFRIKLNQTSLPDVNEVHSDHSEHLNNTLYTLRAQ